MVLCGLWILKLGGADPSLQSSPLPKHHAGPRGSVIPRLRLVGSKSMPGRRLSYSDV